MRIVAATPADVAARQALRAVLWPDCTVDDMPFHKAVGFAEPERGVYFRMTGGAAA